MKSLTAIASFILTSTALWAAGPFERAVLHGETDKKHAIDYAPGEEIVFTLTLQNADPVKEGEWFVAWVRYGDDLQKQCGRVPVTNGMAPIVIRTKLDQPGFVRILAHVVDGKGKKYHRTFPGDATTPEGKAALNQFERGANLVFFDGGAGVQLDRLDTVPEPVDFDEFWAKRKARLAKVPMKVEVAEHPAKSGDAKIFTFSAACAGPRPVTGHYTVPKKPGKYPAFICFHGYGAHFIEQIPTHGPGDRIVMFINAHGYELGREDEYYTEFYNSIMSNGKTFGLDSAWQNKSPDTAYFGWMTYRIMRALQYLKTLPQWNGKDIIAEGGSMGGLQTIWAAGLDSDVTMARPGVPWCCDMGGRETCKRLNPGWSVGETEALRYFDPVNFARRISPKCKVEITRAGLGDYTCPPNGVAIFYNRVRGPKKIKWVQGSTHGYVPKEPHQEFVIESK